MNEEGYSERVVYTWRLLALVALFGVGGVYGVDDETVWLVPWALFAIWLGDMDIRIRLMPRGAIYLGAGVSFAALVLMIVISDPVWTIARDAVIGAVSAFVALLIMRVLSSGVIGGGDVRLAGLLGIGAGSVLGPFGGLIAIALGWLLHGVVALSGLAGRVFTMETRLPLGPSLVLGALGAIFIGGLI